MKLEILVVAFSIIIFASFCAGLTPVKNQVNRRNFLSSVTTTSASLIVGISSPAFATDGIFKNQEIYQPPINSQSGKVHLITGGSSGLGLESSKRIAAAGGTVIFTTRTESKGMIAIQQVQDYLATKNIENSKVYYLTLDLDDFSSIQSFPERFNLLLPNTKIDVIMNNAGVAAIPQREVTKDGFERTFQSNHLGPFLLTSLLFPYLNRDGARIINVSSRAHGYAGDLDLNDLNNEKYTSAGWSAYSKSKLENILFTQELQKRADANGLDWLSSYSLHPGVVGTDIWRSTPLVQKTSTLTSNIFYNNMLTVEEGSNTQIYLATMDSKYLKKGAYYDEHGKIPKLEKFAIDPVKANGLWKISEQLTGIEFNLTQ